MALTQFLMLIELQQGVEMGLEYFFDRTFTIKRPREKDEFRSVFSATGTSAGYYCSWQEPNPETQEMYGQVGNLYSVYVDVSCPIKDGDKIIQAGIEYMVHDIKTMDFGSTQYKRIIATKGDFK